MSFGLEIILCCINAYAHFNAADVGVSLSAFLESVGGGAVCIERLTSMTKSTASLVGLYAYIDTQHISLVLWLERITVSSSSSSSSSSSPVDFHRFSSAMLGASILKVRIADILLTPTFDY